MLAVNDIKSSNTETCPLVKKEEPLQTKNNDEMQYLNMIQNILDNGTKKEDRTGKMNKKERKKKLPSF